MRISSAILRRTPGKEKGFVKSLAEVLNFLTLVGVNGTNNYIRILYAGLVFVQFCTGVQGDIQMGLYVPCKVIYHLPLSTHTLTKDSPNTGNFRCLTLLE